MFLHKYIHQQDFLIHDTRSPVSGGYEVCEVWILLSQLYDSSRSKLKQMLDRTLNPKINIRKVNDVYILSEIF